MASPSQGTGRGKTPESPRAARARLEETLGKMGITDEEVTPLVIDDREGDRPKRWLIAGKVLHRNLLHTNTIAGALRPAWGNP